MSACHEAITDRHRADAVVSIAGNPNTGKSSLFNALTGSGQHIANWPGNTVERREGEFVEADLTVTLVDLPGTYGLTGASPEEIIARDFLVGGEGDAVVIVVDASNLERNLYLATQVLEMGMPTVVALNMIDVARRRRISIDVQLLSDHLGVPVVPTVARTGVGIDELRSAVVSLATDEAVA
jgi:ferrous iron transport protein B